MAKEHIFDTLADRVRKVGIRKFARERNLATSTVSDAVAMPELMPAHRFLDWCQKLNIEVRFRPMSLEQRPGAPVVSAGMKAAIAKGQRQVRR